MLDRNARSGAEPEAEPTWHRVAPLADLPEGGVIGRDCAGRRIPLYRLDGTVHATADLCTHGGARLSEGEVVEGYIECPLHFGLFEIATGKAAGAPVSRDLATYPVRVGEGWIEVRRCIDTDLQTFLGNLK